MPQKETITAAYLADWSTDPDPLFRHTRQNILEEDFPKPRLVEPRDLGYEPDDEIPVSHLFNRKKLSAIPRQTRIWVVMALEIVPAWCYREFAQICAKRAVTVEALSCSAVLDFALSCAEGMSQGTDYDYYGLMEMGHWLDCQMYDDREIHSALARFVTQSARSLFLSDGLEAALSAAACLRHAAGHRAVADVYAGRSDFGKIEDDFVRFRASETASKKAVSTILNWQLRKLRGLWHREDHRTD